MFAHPSRSKNPDDGHATGTPAPDGSRWDTVANALSDKNEKLGTLMDASRDDVLAYM
jgi:hypothetical protein